MRAGLGEWRERWWLAMSDVMQPARTHVRKLIVDRRQRERFFEASLFADPAWDILLDLCDADLAAKPVCVSALCAAAAVPEATAKRWIRILERAQLVEREADRHDRRRIVVRLTVAARDRMHAYLNATA